MNSICVTGLGRIGLPTALTLASRGLPVVGSDSNPSIIEALQKGVVTFEEKGMDALLKAAIREGIKFGAKPAATDFYIVAVPTPYDKGTKKIDPSYVVNAVRDILRVCLPNPIIVIESTVSPGTIDRYLRPLTSETGVKARFAHAPERVIPGRMLYELEHNARVIGADSRETAELIRSVYATFCLGGFAFTDIRSAEMAKIVENTFRDINISFANELAKICRADGMDVYEIIRMANMHPRVNILQPGPGVGGHCISVDPWFLVGDYPLEARLIHEARKINDSMPMYVLERVREIMAENNISDTSRVGFYGISYKEDVDDVRESPTLQLMDLVKTCMGNPPKVFDPMLCERVTPSQYMDFNEFIRDVDFVVIMVGHSHLAGHQREMNDKIVLDTRNVYHREGAYRL
ncbi:MAG: nucleotide sugar dehydrogenase [Clostridiales bacterium]|jgi:UDP-N-acetyl-D-mannosaminuronic acid dehydrogenase|nr:nucleotide sugar dehydrogenase [Clostridiales bacterium]